MVPNTLGLYQIKPTNNEENAESNKTESVCMILSF
jgi:hypothetical protein